jgi:hypothetical protein
LQIFYQFPQKIDISASNVTAISLCQKIRQNKNSPILDEFKIVLVFPKPGKAKQFIG